MWYYIPISIFFRLKFESRLFCFIWTWNVEAERNKYLLTFDNSFKGLFLNFNAFNEILQKGPIKQTTNKSKSKARQCPYVTKIKFL